MTSDAVAASDQGSRPRKRVPRFYVMVGIPGSGKSTYAKLFLGQALRVSLDDLRLMLSNRSFVARLEPLVVEAGTAVADVVAGFAVSHGNDVLFDATNVSRRRRAPWIARARRFGLSPVAVYVEVPLAVALKRNASRPDPVPKDVVENFFRRLEIPSLAEGFDEVITVDAARPLPSEDRVIRVEKTKSVTGLPNDPGLR